ncbi:MAG TPA: hypothetical protein VFX98_08875 [Longimicrobiaceae bacterium]|nr:hypothetical protein [Longimicrobiaceae bacterium]
MNPPTYDQRVVFQLSMYSNLVSGMTGPDLEGRLYAAIKTELDKEETKKKIGAWSIVWGPVVKQFDTRLYAVNAMYVAESVKEPGTYVIGIAGTNPSSLFDWLVEDAFVSKQTPWVFAPRTGARISRGTAIGLAILLNAKPGGNRPGAGTTLLDFARGIGKKAGQKVIVSGHSLGGALSATVTLWLHDVRIIWDPERKVELSGLPTAGPTAGNGAFARYSDRSISVARFANAIDVVPHAWQASDLAKIPTLYAPHIEPNAEINRLVKIAEDISAGGDYTQIVHDTGWFPFPVDRKIINPVLGSFLNFLRQLAYQHTTAYLDYFKIVSPVLDAWAEEFQTTAVAVAPAVAAGFTAEAAATQMTAPIAGQPEVLRPVPDARDRELEARVVEDLLRFATPEQQQQVGIPVDPEKVVDPGAGVGQS